MGRKAESTLSDSVIEHDGMLWQPRRGATAKAEEFIAARTLFVDAHRENRWNPRVLEDREADLERATLVMDQWTRAEPGHRMLTQKQVETRMAKMDEEWERKRVKEEKERAARTAYYSQERAEGRLALIEHHSRLEHELVELASFRDGSRFPRMDPKRREEEIANLDRSIEQRRREIERLSPVVGDPEDVVNEQGWLPRDRRERMLTHYKCKRESEVRKLRKDLSDLDARLYAATDRNERRDLRNETSTPRRRLDELLAIPPLTANDMCSECPTPMTKHGWVTPPFDGPCPAWPGWAARLRGAWEILESASREAKPVTSLVPKPEPLAIIRSGLPIAEVTQRLMELQKEYPDAEVRRGRANRWEIWPKAKG